MEARGSEGKGRRKRGGEEEERGRKIEEMRVGR